MATSPEDLLPVVYLVANRIAPPHEGVEMGIGDATIIKALAEATGRKEAQVKSEYKVRVTKNSGCYGFGRGVVCSPLDMNLRQEDAQEKTSVLVEIQWCWRYSGVGLVGQIPLCFLPPLSGVWRLGIGCKDFSDDSAHHVHSAAPHMCQTARPV